jgi:hypothetical protein
MTDLSGSVFISFGLLHIYILFQVGVQECTFDIHLTRVKVFIAVRAIRIRRESNLMTGEKVALKS